MVDGCSSTGSAFVAHSEEQSRPKRTVAGSTPVEGTATFNECNSRLMVGFEVSAAVGQRDIGSSGVSGHGLPA